MSYSVRPIPPLRPKGFSDLVANLLGSRGICDDVSAQAFVSPDYDAHVHDPFLMKDMDRAVERLYQAIRNNEYIVIFSDYDADGIPGGALLHDLLRAVGYTRFQNYIPHRHDEGFGLNTSAIDSFKEAGTTLLITVDCGIADQEEIAHAASLGIDVIVTDHHVPILPLSAAYAVLDPKQADCTYPEKMLCGSGVAFKYIQAFLARYRDEFSVSIGWEKWLLDLVGIATLSDMVPLVGENRVFAYYGLKVLRKTRRPGLRALYRTLRITASHLSEDDIGFSITPRINAASRMGEPEHAFRLLVTVDEAEAQSLVTILERVNRERKGTVAALVKEIRRVIAERNFDDKEVIVIGNPEWRPALLGLAANSFADEYGKPVFLWGRDGDGIIKGSCRAGGGPSVLLLMEAARGAFIDFGGHHASGGFSVASEAIHSLEDVLLNAFRVLAHSHTEIPESPTADASIGLEYVTWNTYDDIDRLAPYGVGNPKPLFIFRDGVIADIRPFGKEKNHTELVLTDASGRTLSAIQFFSSPDAYGDRLQKGRRIDVVGHIEKSTFKRYPELRLRIIDIV